MTDAADQPAGASDPATLTAATWQQAAEDDADLRASLAGLSQMGAAQLGLTALLTDVAQFAGRAIPNADGVGLTLMNGDRRETVVASADFVRRVDAMQYDIGEGPCITAAAEKCTVSSGSLGGERRWPRFGPRAGRMGVHSVMSLALVGSDSAVVGALNVYARSKDAFDDRAIELGELFAAPAGVSVQMAQALDAARRLSAQLEQALTSRQTIDQAIGIMMSRTGCTPVEAFDKLRVISQTEHRKLAEVARQIRDDAVRRARARLSSDDPPPERLTSR